MKTVKLSIRLFVTHIILSVICLGFLPVLVDLTKNMVIQWIADIIFIAIFWIIIWADASNYGEQDLKRDEHYLNEENDNRNYTYYSLKGFYAGLVASIPGLILFIIMILNSGNEKVYGIFETILKILLVPYIQVFVQFKNLTPGLYLVLLLLFPLISGIGYLHGKVQRQKVKEAISKSNKKHNKKKSKKKRSSF